MPIYEWPVTEVIKRPETSWSGLTVEETKKRLREHVALTGESEPQPRDAQPMRREYSEEVRKRIVNRIASIRR